jgi:hypothetical protein
VVVLAGGGFVMLMLSCNGGCFVLASLVVVLLLFLGSCGGRIVVANNVDDGCLEIFHLTFQLLDACPILLLQATQGKLELIVTLDFNKFYFGIDLLLNQRFYFLLG